MKKRRLCITNNVNENCPLNEIFFTNFSGDGSDFEFFPVLTPLSNRLGSRILLKSRNLKVKPSIKRDIPIDYIKFGTDPWKKSVYTTSTNIGLSKLIISKMGNCLYSDITLIPVIIPLKMKIKPVS